MAREEVLVSKGRIEFYTTELGAMAFNGELENVRAAIAAGVDWELEGERPLEAAVYCGSLEMVKVLIDAGAMISPKTYREFYYYGSKEMLALLPARPDIIGPLEQESRWHNFNQAIIAEDLTKVKALFTKERLNDTSDLLYSETGMTPLHYAARAGNLALIKFLVLQGADVNLLNGNGKSALRLVAECPSVADKERAQAFKFLERHRATLAPPASSWWQLFWLRRGTWLSPH